MEELKELNQILPFLIPIIIAEVILLVVTLRHILTHTTYKRGNRMMWVIIAIIGMQFWGPILYFVLGKEDE
ncbi:MAG: PLDc N-terminal domain-containing protein [Lachnospiraceae bacterium]|nr:PLDc N-terminal domain-containing protein [Lachnospiraceae bacterium]